MGPEEKAVCDFPFFFPPYKPLPERIRHPPPPLCCGPYSVTISHVCGRAGLVIPTGHMPPKFLPFSPDLKPGLSIGTLSLMRPGLLEEHSNVPSFLDVLLLLLLFRCPFSHASSRLGFVARACPVAERESSFLRPSFFLACMTE